MSKNNESNYRGYVGIFKSRDSGKWTFYKSEDGSHFFSSTKYGRDKHMQAFRAPNGSLLMLDENETQCVCGKAVTNWAEAVIEASGSEVWPTSLEKWQEANGEWVKWRGGDRIAA